MEDKILWVCGRPFTVKFLQSELVRDGTVIYADCDPRTLLIRVSGDLHPAQKRSSLWHEWLHACVAIAGGKALADMPDHEEGYVRAIETSSYESIRDPRNKWFSSYVFEDDNELGCRR